MRGRERKVAEERRRIDGSESKPEAGNKGMRPPSWTLISLQVLICGNSRDSTIKSGSMGKASPPYDVQVGSLCTLCMEPSMCWGV